MTIALITLLQEHINQLVKVTHKFMKAGHSCIQDIDAAHSGIERHAPTLYGKPLLSHQFVFHYWSIDIL